APTATRHLSPPSPGGPTPSCSRPTFAARTRGVVGLQPIFYAHFGRSSRSNFNCRISTDPTPRTRRRAAAGLPCNEARGRGDQVVGGRDEVLPAVARLLGQGLLDGKSQLA